MAYPLLNSYNLSEGLQVPLIYVNDITHNIFMKTFFACLFIGVSLSSYFVQLRRKGDANIWATFSVVGLGVFLFMLLLSVIPGLVSNSDLIVGAILESLFIIILFTTERQSF